MLRATEVYVVNPGMIQKPTFGLRGHTFINAQIDSMWECWIRACP